MRPWESKHWIEAHNYLINYDQPRDSRVTAIMMDGMILAYQRLTEALKKDWEEQQMRQCISCNESFKPRLLDAIRCPKCGGSYQ